VIRLFKFASVGIAATLVHYISALAAAIYLAMHPEIANIIGFLVAFMVSFMGHWRWTFRDHAARFRQAMPAFALLAMAMFLINALILHILLAHFSFRFELSLFFAQAFIVAITYAASKYWAFAKPLQIKSDQSCNY
jgi:putative flippase GtrA